MSKRTIREFDYEEQDDVWELIKSWAITKGFDLKEKSSNGKRRVYQKSISILGEKFYVEFDVSGKKVHLEAYYVDILFGEKPIDSETKGPGAKKLCRDLLKELMVAFDQPAL